VNRSLKTATGLFAGILLVMPIIVTAEETERTEQGFELAREFCFRCHVIGDYNRMGGIGNLPSFPWMAKSADWQEPFTTFYSRRPHLVFARVPGYARWSESDPYYPPFEIALKELDLIVDYVENLRSPE